MPVLSVVSSLLIQPSTSVNRKPGVFTSRVSMNLLRYRMTCTHRTLKWLIKIHHFEICIIDIDNIENKLNTIYTCWLKFKLENITTNHAESRISKGSKRNLMNNYYYQVHYLLLVSCTQQIDKSGNKWGFLTNLCQL